jgi:hypothetical protein
LSPKFIDKKSRIFNGNKPFNGNNRERLPRQDKKNQDRKDQQALRNSTEKDRESKINNKNEVTLKDKSPEPCSSDAQKEMKQEKRPKTAEELEDELLASTDSEGSLKGDDGLEMILDEKELDFLDDDEEESENEGRFKSKASTTFAPAKKQTPTTSNFKSSNYSSRNYDKPKTFNSNERNYQRNDHRRNNYVEKEDKKREKPRSPKEEKRYISPIRRTRKTPEVRNSPEKRTTTKESMQSSKIIINKEKSKDEQKPQKSANLTFHISIDPENKKKGKTFLVLFEI